MNGEPRPQALKVLSPVPDGWPTPEQGVKRQLPKFENVSPTYVIRVSAHRDIPLVHRVKVALGDAMRRLDHGYDIVTGIGYWDGVHEPSVTVSLQATDDVLRVALSALSKVPGIRWAHVEKHEVPTSYVDLETWR